eukprot:TRINITY_DN10346_c0_g1_i2.p1 TRINITY_DN10346_c0_g1~~TRINITY_DN10346_c0_g1_i2.p1  ORF type:complete len:377 (+),score=50.47 TRINITY_DN10346_c0_g1_i2:439-1569(+)
MLDISAMTNCRGFKVEDIGSGVLMKDETPRFWLSIESLPQDADRTCKWCEDVENFRRMYPTPQHSILPQKSFKTRRTSTKNGYISHHLRIKDCTINLERINRLVINARMKSVASLLSEMTNTKGKCLPEDWPLKEFKVRPDEDLAERIEELNAPNIRVKIDGDCREPYRHNVNAKLRELARILHEVRSISALTLTFHATCLNDEGCEQISLILQTSRSVTSLEISISCTDVTDAGLTSLASELRYLPLRDLSLTFADTQITDVGIVSLSESLRHLSSSLAYLALWPFSCAGIPDVGVMALVSAMALLPHLSTLNVWFYELSGVTDRSGEALIELVKSMPNLIELDLSFIRSGVTWNFIDQIRALRSERHEVFRIDF